MNDLEADLEANSGSAGLEPSSRRPPNDKAIVIRMTEAERDALNLESQQMQVSLNALCRYRLGLPADLSPTSIRPGNPGFFRDRSQDGKKGRARKRRPK